VCTLLALLVAAAGSDPMPAAAPLASGCTGTLAGAVNVKFACTVDATKAVGKEAVLLIIAVPQLPEGVMSMAPATFEIALPLAPKTYTLETLTQASLSVVAGDGKMFMAGKTLGMKMGTLKLTLTRGAVSPTNPQAYRLAGTISAVATSMEGRGKIKALITF